MNLGFIPNHHQFAFLQMNVFGLNTQLTAKKGGRS